MDQPRQPEPVTDTAPAFRAVGHRSLARIGLAGAAVDVALAPDGLALTDTDGHWLDIPFDVIDRVRFGYQTLRTGGRLYDMRVWTQGSPRPILLRHALRDTSPGYAALARGLAAAVAGRRGVGRVEAGLGWGDALFYLCFLLPFIAYGSWASIDGFLRGFPLLFLLILPTAVLLVGGMIGYGLARLWFPRRLSSLAGLEPLISKEARPWLF